MVDITLLIQLIICFSFFIILLIPISLKSKILSFKFPLVLPGTGPCSLD